MQDDDYFVMNVKILAVCEEFNAKFNLLHIRKINKLFHSVCNKIYPVSHINNKCLFINLHSSSYACIFLNVFEIQ